MRRTLAILTIVLVAAIAATASWAGSSSTRIGLAAYAVPREALGEIIEAWQKTPNGSGVAVAQSYGASGDQARAVANGLPVDVVQLSTGLDIDSLVKKDLVDDNWDEKSYGGIVTNSLVVFAVRPGNPKRIRAWSDLVKPGVQVVSANPFTSGAAKWTILAAYGAQRKTGKTDRQGQAYVKALLGNVVVQAKSGRDATNAFLSGKGDVLLTYENEALLSRTHGQELRFTIPQQSMLIEAPIAVLRDSENRRKANQFIEFAKSDPAQRIWAEWGFRPVSKRVAREFRAKYPSPPVVFRISDPIFGGWQTANRRWFDPKGSIMVDIEKSIGVSPG